MPKKFVQGSQLKKLTKSCYKHRAEVLPTVLI